MKLKFEVRVKGGKFHVPCYQVEADNEEEVIEMGRRIIRHMTVTRDAVGRISVKPNEINCVEILPVKDFTGNYDSLPEFLLTNG